MTTFHEVDDVYADELHAALAPITTIARDRVETARQLRDGSEAMTKLHRQLRRATRYAHLAAEGLRTGRIREYIVLATDPEWFDGGRVFGPYTRSQADHALRELNGAHPTHGYRILPLTFDFAANPTAEEAPY